MGSKQHGSVLGADVEDQRIAVVLGILVDHRPNLLTQFLCILPCSCSCSSLASSVSRFRTFAFWSRSRMSFSLWPAVIALPPWLSSHGRPGFQLPSWPASA